jgi:hypothetical protein
MFQRKRALFSDDMDGAPLSFEMSAGSLGIRLLHKAVEPLVPPQRPNAIVSNALTDSALREACFS